jgi:hypothetical protein
MKRKSRKDSVPAGDLEIPETPAGFFKHGVMGKYYHEYRRGGHRPVCTVTLEDDVAAVFPDSQSVNSVLRATIHSVPDLRARRRKSA